MESLFIDTSHFIRIGLLNDQFEWVDFMEIETNRGASIFHSKLYNFLGSNKTEIGKIKDLFLINGPGSYTGIRLAEGMAQILEWHAKKVYSLYSFEIPFLSGVHQGRLSMKAFKKEVFIYEWEGEKTKMQLVSEDNFDYATSEKERKENIRLLKECSCGLFKKVKNRGSRLGPFYFRTLEKEFNTNSIK